MKPKIILDSGAYTAYRQGTQIDIDKYAEFVVTHQNKFENFFNLDVIGDDKSSYRAWKYLLDAGAKTIPVFHIGTDEKFLKKYLQQTDYIGLGAIASLSTKKRVVSLQRIWKEYLTDTNGHASCRAHGLGVTALPIIKMFPWYSVDSFTPIFAASYGSVFLPLIHGDKLDYLNGFLSPISAQAKYDKGNSTAYINLPKYIQDTYFQLFEEYGYTVGQVKYEKKTPRRKDKGVVRTSTFFELQVHASGVSGTLANDWKMRLQWNLVMWRKVIDSLAPYQGVHKDIDKPILYVGNSGTHIMESICQVQPIHDMLVSFAYLTPPFYEKLEPFLK